jgi:hypothetical protein
VLTLLHINNGVSRWSGFSGVSGGGLASSMICRRMAFVRLRMLELS